MSTKDTEHHDIGCLEAIEVFYAWLDGELDDPKAIEEFEHHMRHCRSCYSRTDVEKLLSRRIAESARTRAPGALHDRLRRLMDEFE